MLWALLVIAAVYVLCLLKDGADRKFKAQSFEFSLNRCLINPLLLDLGYAKNQELFSRS